MDKRSTASTAIIATNAPLTLSSGHADDNFVSVLLVHREIESLFAKSNSISLCPGRTSSGHAGDNFFQYQKHISPEIVFSRILVPTYFHVGTKRSSP